MTSPRALWDDDEACLDYLWRRNHSKDGRTATCTACRVEGPFAPVSHRRAYRCVACGSFVYPTAGTIFERSSTPLHVWFRAIELIADSRGAISSRAMQRELGVSGKTAWRIGRLIRDQATSTGLTVAAIADRRALLELATRPRQPVPPATTHPPAGAWAPGVISTFAGDGCAGYGGDGQQATAAQLDGPQAVVVGPTGDVFIADGDNHVIRRVGPDGIISTFAGNGSAGYSGDGGPATQAQLTSPVDLAVGADGSLYIADVNAFTVRRVDPSGTISTVAGSGRPGAVGDGGPATLASLRPVNVALLGRTLLVADYASNRVRQVDESGTISTFAGDGGLVTHGDGGLATKAGVPHPRGMCVDGEGNVYVTQLALLRTTDGRVRKVHRDGTITTFAGIGLGGFAGDGGLAVVASFRLMYSIVAGDDGSLLVADNGNCRVRRIDSRGRLTTVAGSGVAGFSGNGGPAVRAALGPPCGIALSPAGDLFIVDYDFHRVRRVTGPLPS